MLNKVVVSGASVNRLENSCAKSRNSASPVSLRPGPVLTSAIDSFRHISSNL